MAVSNKLIFDKMSPTQIALAILKASSLQELGKSANILLLKSYWVTVILLELAFLKHAVMVLKLCVKDMCNFQCRVYLQLHVL